ncbi:MAG: arginase family protein [Anaerolineae bacterium]|jgi:agmatinase|nr:arginase family protein [Anaerolineae bacterium]
MNPVLPSFANLPVCTKLEQLEADIAILGVPYGTPYDQNDLHSIHAPAALRKESVRYSDDPIAWDFDLDGTFLGDGSTKVVDCLDIPGIADDPAFNKTKTIQAVQQILRAGAIPVILGGDDSIPIPVFQAFSDQPAFTVLQFDAHIDWRDAVNGVRDGYSSTMRRASEMPWVSGIIQVGAHGVGSARKEELEAARSYGAKIIPAAQFQQQGIVSVTQHLAPNSRVFISMDYDVLDQSIMPAVGAPSPGGLHYTEVINLIKTIVGDYDVVGVNLVEFVPEADLHSLGAITAMRVAWMTIGSLIQKRSKIPHHK